MNRQFWFWLIAFSVIFTASHAAITSCIMTRRLNETQKTKINLELNGGHYLLSLIKDKVGFELWGDDENTVLRVRVEEDHLPIVRDYPVELITTSVKKMNVLIEKIPGAGCQITLMGVDLGREIINFGIHFVTVNGCQFYKFEPKYEGEYACFNKDE